VAQPLDPHAPGDLAHGGRLGQVAPAVGLAGVGRRQLDLGLERLEPLADRERDEPAGADGAAGGREEPGSLGSSWIVCIGTATSAKAPASKPAASATTVRTRRPSARASSSASSSGSMSSAVTSWPARARSSATRPVPAPTSSTGPPASRASRRHSGRSAAYLPHSTSCHMTLAFTASTPRGRAG
jgi:hypothetical protein